VTNQDTAAGTPLAPLGEVPKGCKPGGEADATTPDHAGIIVCAFDPDFVALAHRSHAALEAQPATSGQLVRINRPGWDRLRNYNKRQKATKFCHRGKRRMSWIS
jgi:hypothetical protein